jgi:molybdate transport system substrate-binding protein
MVQRLLAVVVACVIGASAVFTQARGPLTIAAASDLQTVLPELTMAFERATGISTRVTFGSSGNFVAQIQNGAPFDVFLSADADYPRRLATAGQIDAPTVCEYATGLLVSWTRRDTGLDVTKGLPLLLDERVRRIAIANPAVAPYGRAAVAALRSAGVFDSIEKKLVYAENVAQAAQFALSGNADVALIGHGLAVSSTLRAAGRFYDVPERLHPPIVQAGGVVAASRNKESGQAFLEYLKGGEARATLRSFGFGLPPTATPTRP